MRAIEKNVVVYKLNVQFVLVIIKPLPILQGFALARELSLV